MNRFITHEEFKRDCADAWKRVLADAERAKTDPVFAAELEEKRRVHELESEHARLVQDANEAADNIRFAKARLKRFEQSNDTRSAGKFTGGYFGGKSIEGYY